MAKRLHHPQGARRSGSADGVPGPAPQRPTVAGAHALRACPCGGSCPRCAGAGRWLSPADVPEARVHPASNDVTAALGARAVTLGRDIHFREGEYRPGTPAGDGLLAHELAHVLQGRASGGWGGEPQAASQPGEAIERNADALARGETHQVLPAPAGVALRSPFDQESAEDRGRREVLLQAIANAQANLLQLLQSSGLVEGLEVASERNGVRGVLVNARPGDVSADAFESYAARDARLRRILRNLAAMGTLYRTAPIPAALPPAEAGEGGDYTTTIQPDPHVEATYGAHGGPAWSQLQAAYELYRVSVGQTGDAYEPDWYYLRPELRITPGAARGAPRLGRGTPSGAYMVVPDIEHEPLRYWRLSGFDPIPRGSVIVEFWHDDLGYYYLHRGRRIDVPSPWAP